MAANKQLLRHPSISKPASAADWHQTSNSNPHPIEKHGRAGCEAGARAAAVQPEHGRAHRGGLHPVPRPRRRRRAGGAGDHVAEGARHDVPQGRVGGGRVHGRGGPARGPRGGRRARRRRVRAGLLALPEPPLRGPDLRGLHVPAPRRRRTPPVARDGVPQAHLGNGAAGDGRVPALVDAGGVGEARRPAREAAVCSVTDFTRVRRARAISSRKKGSAARTTMSSLSVSLGAAAGRRSIGPSTYIWSPLPERGDVDGVPRGSKLPVLS